ncbi:MULTISPECIES: PepSY-associated TM helix domain-containing protein [unclassified Alteromonas]|jgi:uncharacterized iron-regulated membrane protein|uniref:PepSY-associated TM helix domain-containing protein n=1 Tax=unclassified Alteromonas TaxID=2614992 RepID=UPI001EF38D24|nr:MULTISPECIES: PepSY-associated TM helix domain-containing protein [unclassified Alteromonas]MCG7636449.1 PepSY domain-containing protein [Alteromonas sp. CNT1-28]MCG7811416.1 PepSY domain-containing protein [Alteromonas sp. MCA-1]
MKKALTLLHRWVGFPIGVLFIVTLGSGLITGVVDYISVDRDFGQKYHRLSNSELSAHLRALHERHSGYRSIKVPQPSSPVFEVALRGEKYIYSAVELQLLDHEVSTQNSFSSFVLGLHRNFLIGRQQIAGLAGKEWVAWVGLVALAISLLGVYLWWPHRKTFKLKRLVPTANKNSHYFFAHLSGGIVTVAFVLLFSITGAAITYRSVAQSILKEEAPIAHVIPEYMVTPWIDMLNLAENRFEDPQLMSVGTVRARGSNSFYSGALQLKYHTVNDWLGFAGSSVYVDTASGALLGQEDFGQLAFGEKLYRFIVPLHTGRNLPSLYLLVMIGIMTLALIMVLSGVISFVVKKSRQKKKLVNGFNNLVKREASLRKKQ